jgi:putative chitinase
VHVFISYGCLDRPRVEPVNEALQELGLSTFFDIEGIDGGDTFPDTIDQAVKSAGAVIACWTPYSVQRDWVKKECAIGLQRKALVPVEIETVTDMDVPAAFFTLHRVNLVDWNGERDHTNWLALVRAIAKKLGRPELYDRARAAATVKGKAIPTHDASVMDDLWTAWMQFATGSDRAALAGLVERAKGTVIEQLAKARLGELDGTANAIAERERIEAEKDALIRQLKKAATSSRLIRTNAFLRGLTRDTLAPFFQPYPAGMAFADGMLRRTDILSRAELDTPLRLSHFLAQIAYETNGFSVVTENLNFSGPRLLQIFPRRFKDEAEAMTFDKQPERIANRIYANRIGNGDEASGDGWRYRGRGFIGLTGRANYRALGETIGVDIEADPDQVFDPEVSLAIAAAFWSSRGMNARADTDDIRVVTRAFNGGVVGLPKRQKLLELAKQTLGV